MLGSKGDVVVRMEVSGGDSDGPILFQEVVDDRCDLTTAGDSQGARRRAKVVLPVKSVNLRLNSRGLLRAFLKAI